MIPLLLIANRTIPLLMTYTAILSNFNITELNQMQKATMEAIAKPNDVVLISPTGSGKTLAFLLPILKILNADETCVQVLILVPTRELAIQIEQVFKLMNSGFKINCCYGGHSVRIEENNFQHPPAVLVGTPGRLSHHLRRKNLVLDNVHTLILDEFDKSLELGFKEEMEYIIKQCTQLKKRILTSATTLKEIPSFVRLTNATELNYSTQHKELTSSLIIKEVRAEGGDKLKDLMFLLGKIGDKPTIVLRRT